jgi:hypothetical protein
VNRREFSVLVGVAAAGLAQPGPHNNSRPRQTTRRLAWIGLRGANNRFYGRSVYCGVRSLQISTMQIESTFLPLQRGAHKMRSAVVVGVILVETEVD